MGIYGLICNPCKTVNKVPPDEVRPHPLVVTVSGNHWYRNHAGRQSTKVCLINFSYYAEIDWLRILGSGTVRLPLSRATSARERQESTFRAPKQRVEDFEELHEYRGRKRKEFEERVRRTRGSIKEWTRYANWEANQDEFDRSRSIFERALDVDPNYLNGIF
ncbi:hypothetical protein CY34DRAFT_18530 [Suillus luteus UH-Slu-Lm8-n1]|uniref:Uncharacterized protein n=1 Tax=Suillus luteus UH-Slu-Lm8-n1 TaxID=930992 RepID=A0A0C9Z6P0_9AGAM|nr:hypothetical protein CY34DRAFT_18530 [Suillus luteus UH-Slu-Lm8-n1]